MFTGQYVKRVANKTNGFVNIKNILVLFGTAEGEFKLRYNNLTMLFRHKNREKDAELSKYLWKLKKNADHNLQWSIKVYASLYKCETRKCDLRLLKK